MSVMSSGLMNIIQYSESFLILYFLSLIERSIKMSFTENVSIFHCGSVSFCFMNFAALYIYKYVHKFIKLLCPPA